MDRDAANATDGLALLGFDHPLVQAELSRWQALEPEQVGVAVRAEVEIESMLTIWRVEASSQGGPAQDIAAWSTDERRQVFERTVEAALQRELQQRALTGERGGYSAELIGCVELVPGQ